MYEQQVDMGHLTAWVRYGFLPQIYFTLGGGVLELDVKLAQAR